ncbi:HlyC/CorC family transporter [Proteiniclasticum ruminis]|uniref:Hemolysin, contains CBS domains n=1 Tax=Proteiniclasticum ruminis TaxID=398199 RepID=A0A1G8Q9G9_9CLOT|nr:hemolysin family protein [Proteiniclasticum ruminis]SDJ01248.1 Hemolysin, contains CBS domains [Proteiniclasticum ruminis]
MDPSSWQIILLVTLVILSAFFSSAETAFTAANRLKLRHMAEEGSKSAKRTLRLIENPSKLISALLIGNNIVNIFASSLATLVAIDLYGISATGIATSILTIIIIIFGEITPKSFATQHAEKVSMMFSKPVGILMTLLTPFVITFYSISSWIIKLFGGDISHSHPLVTEEELKTMVDVGSEEGVFEQEEKEMLHNIFDFGDLQVRDIMVQRVDITALDVDATYEEVLEIVKDEQFSRFPVYREDIDDIIGILNVKDLLFLTEVEKQGFKLENYIREPYFAYEFKRITDLFKELKKTRTHISIILDEYGGTVGIVTIEDLLEEIVGEIDDEYDDDKETDIETIRKNEYMVSGSYRLDELNELIGTDIESEEFDSIGGYLIGILGTFPASGEVIEADGIRFVVDEVDKNRIKKIRMILKPKQTEF